VTAAWWKNLIDEAISMMRVAAPHEFANARLYICPADRLCAAGKTVGKTLYGQTSPDCDLVVRPFVEWSGRGAALIFAKEAMEAEGETELGIRMVFLSLVVHEFSHVLREGYLSRLKMEKQEPDADVISLSRSLAVEDFERIEMPRPVGRAIKGIADDEIRHHDDAWLRVCSHIKHRLEKRLGELLALSQICHRWYGPHASRYSHALGGEQERCGAWPIEAILAMPMPHEFAQLWELAKKDCYAVAEQRAMDAEMQREAARVLHEAKKNHIADVGEAQVVCTLPDAGNVQENANMNVTAWIEKLGLRKKKRKQTAKEGYKELVRKTADGEWMSEEKADAILDAAGKDETQLLADVQRIIDRRGWRQTRLAAAYIAKEREKLAAKSAEADHKKQKADEEYDTVTMEIVYKERELAAEENRAKAAEDELIRTAPEEAKAALREAERDYGQKSEALRQAHMKRAQAQETRTYLSPAVKAAAPTYENGVVVGPTAEWQKLGFLTMEEYADARAKVQAADAAIIEQQAIIERLTPELAQAQARVDAARAALLIAD